jgi:hypothetical protein
VCGVWCVVRVVWRWRLVCVRVVGAFVVLLGSTCVYHTAGCLSRQPPLTVAHTALSNAPPHTHTQTKRNTYDRHMKHSRLHRPVVPLTVVPAVRLARQVQVGGRVLREAPQPVQQEEARVRCCARVACVSRMRRACAHA